MEHFFAYTSRMRFISRWALMRNSQPENIQEHSHQVAVLAHALAVIRNRCFGGQVDPGTVAVAALYHDASEILTGDLPTPIKYYNPAIRDAYKQVEHIACGKLVGMLPPALLQKYIRLKRIKVNGGRAQRDQRLQEGDVLQLYINDEFFDKPREDNLFLTLFRPSLDIVYEDENLMLLNKRPGLVVHADETEKVNTLINHIQAYLYQKREWNPRWENAFTPALCNRIDRNTGGIVIAAKNAETLRIINQKIRDREIDKRYLCITVGAPRPPQGEVSCFLLKDEKKKQVAVYHRPVPGGKTAVTRYRTLETRGELSLLEVELLTGRTHQIRATMADLGCPLLGDGKYGDGQVNRRYGETRQALYSYRLTFDFPTDAGLLNYLRGRSFQVESVPFREKYFG